LLTQQIVKESEREKFGVSANSESGSMRRGKLVEQAFCLSARKKTLRGRKRQFRNRSTPRSHSKTSCRVPTRLNPVALPSVHDESDAVRGVELGEPVGVARDGGARRKAVAI